MSLEQRFASTSYDDLPVRQIYKIQVRGYDRELPVVSVIDHFEQLYRGEREFRDEDRELIRDIVAELRISQKELQVKQAKREADPSFDATRGVPALNPREQAELESSTIALEVATMLLGKGPMVQADRRQRSEITNMSIEEVVNEIEEGYIGDSQRLKEVINRFINLIGTVNNARLAAEYKSRVGLQAISRAGDTGKEDFAVFYDGIIGSLASNGVSLLDLARGIFLKDLFPNNLDQPVAKDQLANAVIHEQLIVVWDYIVKRIKGKPEFGGLGPNPSDPTDKDFSYKVLVDDRVEEFRRHIKDRFSHIDEGRIALMIKFAQNMDIKSVGYIPWLLRETTRSHGTALATVEDKTFADTLFVSAPFAAGAYSRGRYGGNKTNSTAEQALFMSEETFAGVVESATRLNNMKKALAHEKVEGAKALWEVVNKYRLAIWGEIPGWVMDVRKMIDDGTLDLNESWFPLPGEIIIANLKLEQKKREIIAMPDKKDRQIAERAFLKKWNQQGYGNSNGTSDNLKDFGIARLEGLSYDNIKAAYAAVDKMHSTFEEMPIQLSYEQATLAFETWLDKVVGKAKLVPGLHHLLLGPMTTRYMHRLTHSYENRFEPAIVERLRSVFMEELEQASGVPDYVKNYVGKYMGKTNCWTLTTGTRTLREGRYKATLARFLAKRSRNLTVYDKVMLRIPGAFGKKDASGKPIKLVSPWHTNHEVNKDTRAS